MIDPLAKLRALFPAAIRQSLGMIAAGVRFLITVNRGDPIAYQRSDPLKSGIVIKNRASLCTLSDCDPIEFPLLSGSTLIPICLKWGL